MWGRERIHGQDIPFEVDPSPRSVCSCGSSVDVLHQSQLRATLLMRVLDLQQLMRNLQNEQALVITKYKPYGIKGQTRSWGPAALAMRIKHVEQASVLPLPGF